MTRYYRLDEANARLAELRPLLEHLREDRDAVALAQADIERRRRTNGDAGHAQKLREQRDDVRERIERMRAAVERVAEWDVELRDIDTGLVDFPALASGRPIWLCWRLGEDEIGWWHEPDTGFSDRRPLIELT